MVSPKKIYVNTTVDADLFKSFKVLAAHEGKRLNHLLEEAIRDLLEKYDHESGYSLRLPLSRDKSALLFTAHGRCHRGTSLGYSGKRARMGTS